MKIVHISQISDSLGQFYASRRALGSGNLEGFRRVARNRRNYRHSRCHVRYLESVGFFLEKRSVAHIRPLGEK